METTQPDEPSPGGGDSDQSNSAPPPPPGPSEPKRVFRRRDDRVIGGVASGLARYLNIDPAIIRVAFVLSVFAGGLGVVAYALAMLIIPEDPATKVPPSEVSRHEKVLSITVLVIASCVALGALNHAAPVIIAGLLIAAGVYLLRDQRSGPVTATPPPSTPPANEATITTPAYGGAPYTPPTPPAAPIYVARRRDRSPLGLLTLGLAMIATGAAVVVAHNDVIDLDAQQVLAVPFVVLGLGLLVGSFFGRAKGLMFPAAVLLPFVMASSIGHFPVHSGAGDVRYMPATISDLQPKYEMGAGKVVLDLNSLPVTADKLSTKVEVGAGDVLVILPPNRPYVIDSEVGAGQLEILGEDQGGPGSDISVTSAEGTGGQIDLRLSVGLGHIRVDPAGTPAPDKVDHGRFERGNDLPTTTVIPAPETSDVPGTSVVPTPTTSTESPQGAVR